MQLYKKRIVPFLLLALAGIQGYGQFKVTTDGANTILTTANASTDAGVTVAQMKTLDALSLFDLQLDATGGIIGNVQSGGFIKLEVFNYEPAKPGGIGPLLYAKQLGATTTSFGGNGYDVQNGPVAGRMVSSTSTKTLLEHAAVYNKTQLPCQNHADNVFEMGLGSIKTATGCVTAKTSQPIVVRITQSKASVSSIKVPGVGILRVVARPVMPPFASYTGPAGPVYIAAHRGDWEALNRPENTVSSISQAAYTPHVNMVELDVSISKDNVPFVFHDQGLNKRTDQSGRAGDRNIADLKGLYITNRFDELAAFSDGKLLSLADALNSLSADPQNKTFIQLDRSANSMHDFEIIYNMVKDKKMLHRCIFKGRYNPVSTADPDGQLPTVANFRTVFKRIYPTFNPDQIDSVFYSMYFTPVLFDDTKQVYTEAIATTLRAYIDSFALQDFADGFELNFKAFLLGNKYNKYSIDNNDHVLIQHNWHSLGDKNFVEYVHDNYKLPVGIFASEPEVSASPQYNGGARIRDLTNLQSGFVKEIVSGDNPSYLPEIRPAGLYDFRGDSEFFLFGGADYVITDRPNLLVEYLMAIGRVMP